MTIQTIIAALPDDGKGRKVVTTTTCSDCGATVHIKLNKNNLAYYCCGNFYDGEYCANQKKFGRFQTSKLLEEAAKQRGISHDAPKPDYRQDRTTVAAPGDSKKPAGAKPDGNPATGGGFLDDFLGF